MLKGRGKKSGAIAAAAGFAAALFATSLVPANAGPFSWLTGKNQQQQQLQQDQQLQPSQPPQQQGGRPGLFPFFGGGRNQQWQGNGPDPVTAPHASELPRDDPEAMLITNPPLGSPTLAARNVEATKAAIEQYKVIVAQGGWQSVPAKAMRPGQRGQEIALLQRRLEISGDLVGQSVQGEYDAAVVAAVKKFQTRHGIGATGVIDTKAVIQALNVPAYMRLAQLQASLRRLQSLTPSAAGRYVVVNIPAAQVETVAGGAVDLRQIAVVGKPERPTPEISSKIQEINFNPYWYVPRTIIIKDLVPKGREFARRGQSMLDAYHMEAFDAAGNPVTQIDWNNPEVYNYNFRQRPHGENSLGFVKINFPNKDSVYMHDTPLKGLFANNERFQSSGCVRVYNVEQVVSWILRDTPGWSYDRIVSMKHTGEQMDVKLAKPVPVYLAYISAWGTPDGLVNFRPDIYGLDGASTTASAY
ncbi:MAG TPA: L,D-transpeptidase family protein [Methyloceanibacter sp.]|nr:L,D-transpeptidase family protein [Methyloceanibacter sp.]